MGNVLTRVETLGDGPKLRVGGGSMLGSSLECSVFTPRDVGSCKGAIVLTRLLSGGRDSEGCGPDSGSDSLEPIVSSVGPDNLREYLDKAS